MSKLEDLYEGKKRLERAGYKLTTEQLKDLDELEEQLIISEVLPTLCKDIEPRLSKIERDLVLEEAPFYQQDCSHYDKSST